jgi:nitrate reductase molybdenum cofactor assembly chaperone
MRPEVAVHDALARLLEYPRDGYMESVEESARLVAAANSEAADALQPFIDYARAQPLHVLEETFTRTFDNSADRALEVGWHTFGENYTRGTFMVRMRQRLREVGVEENGELPDHLSHVMALLGRAEASWAGDMAHDTVAPAVTKIHDALTSQENPWAPVLAATQIILAMHEHSPRQPAGANIPSSWPPPPPLPEHDGPGCGFGEEPCHE